MKILLIDLENCPSQTCELLKNLADYSKVVICYAQSGAKIPIDWLMPLTAAINNHQLKIIKMPNKGKNAADFGITFYAGVLMAKSQEQTHFDIISNDADLDFVIDLLVSKNHTAKRIGRVKKELALTIVSEKSLLTTQLKEYCSHLAKHQHRPAKQVTLINSIKSKFQNNVDADTLLKELVRQNVVAVDNQKIVYNSQKINLLKTP